MISWFSIRFFWLPQLLPIHLNWVNFLSHVPSESWFISYCFQATVRAGWRKTPQWAGRLLPQCNHCPPPVLVYKHQVLPFQAVELPPPGFWEWLHRLPGSAVFWSPRLLCRKGFWRFASPWLHTDYGKEERSWDPFPCSLPGLLARCRAPPFLPGQRYCHQAVVTADREGVRCTVSLNQAGCAILCGFQSEEHRLSPHLPSLPPESAIRISCSEGRNYNIFPYLEAFSKSRVPWENSTHAHYKNFKCTHKERD